MLFVKINKEDITKHTLSLPLTLTFARMLLNTNIVNIIMDSGGMRIM